MKKIIRMCGRDGATDSRSRHFPSRRLSSETEHQRKLHRKKTRAPAYHSSSYSRGRESVSPHLFCDQSHNLKRQAQEGPENSSREHKTEEYILTTLRAGADGYIPKDATRSELMLAVENIFSGRSYLSPRISEKVIEGYLEGRKTAKSSTSWDTLTQRERETLKMIAEDFNKDIADYLCISAKTGFVPGPFEGFPRMMRPTMPACSSACRTAILHSDHSGT